MRPSEREIRAAAFQAVIQFAEEIPDVPEYTFSPQFLRKMKEMIALRKRKLKLQQRINRLKIALMALIGAASLLIYTNPDVYASITDWIREAVDNAYHYFVNNENPEAPPSSYQPTWIPEGYELLFCDSIDTSTTYLYEKETEKLPDYITITYTIKEPNEAHNIMPLEDNYILERKVIWGKFPADLYLAGDSSDCNTLIWIDPQYNMMFIVSSYLGEEEILKIAENIIPIYE